MRLLPFILALVLLTGCLVVPIPHTTVRATGIEGTVLDARTHAPIAGALIYRTEHPEASCHTDSSGHFLLKEIRNWHYAKVLGAGGESHLPDQEYWSDYRLTVLHTNYATWDSDRDTSQGTTFFLNKLEEPSDPRPWLIFNGNGTILQDMGAARYLRPGEIHLLKQADGKPSGLHIGFTRRVYEPRVTALHNPDKAEVSVYGPVDYGRGRDWEFRIYYRHRSPNVSSVKDSSRIYRLDFIR
jgi:hypothetical protein